MNQVTRRAVRFLAKHPWASLGLTAVVAAPAASQLYTWHILNKQKRLAQDQNMRLHNLQKLQQAQFDSSMSASSTDMLTRQGKQIVASPLT